MSVETWKALLAEADQFDRLAPWEWMHDSQIIGLRHPVSKELLLGPILGRYLASQQKNGDSGEAEEKVAKETGWIRDLTPKATEEEQRASRK